jgi:hypothetical protein
MPHTLWVNQTKICSLDKEGKRKEKKKQREARDRKMKDKKEER